MSAIYVLNYYFDILLRYYNSFKIFRIHEKRSVPLTYIFPALIANISWILRRNEDLHVFIPNEFDLDKSLDQFHHMYSLRTRTNQEFWLLDVSYWLSINDTVNVLQDLPIDLGSIHKLQYS